MFVVGRLKMYFKCIITFLGVGVRVWRGCVVVRVLIVVGGGPVVSLRPHWSHEP